MISGWVQTVTEHRGTKQYLLTKFYRSNWIEPGNIKLRSRESKKSDKFN